MLPCSGLNINIICEIEYSFRDESDLRFKTTINCRQSRNPLCLVAKDNSFAGIIMRHAEAIEILELAPNINPSPSEIKRAYLKKALETHPDKNGSGDCEAFKRVSLAYQVLNDLKKEDKELENIDPFKLYEQATGTNWDTTKITPLQYDFMRVIGLFSTSYLPLNSIKILVTTNSFKGRGCSLSTIDCTDAARLLSLKQGDVVTLKVIQSNLTPEKLEGFVQFLEGWHELKDISYPANLFSVEQAERMRCHLLITNSQPNTNKFSCLLM